MEVAWVDWYCAREALVLAMYTSSGSLEDDDDIMASVLSGGWMEFEEEVVRAFLGCGGD